jgi:hypothetical protein
LAAFCAVALEPPRLAGSLFPIARHTCSDAISSPTPRLFDSNEFCIDAVRALLGGVDTNFVLSGVWNRLPWRVWLHEPTDTLTPSQWVLELGDHHYPLHQSAGWEMNPHTKTWEQSKSSCFQPFGM